MMNEGEQISDEKLTKYRSFSIVLAISFGVLPHWLLPVLRSEQLLDFFLHEHPIVLNTIIIPALSLCFVHLLLLSLSSADNLGKFGVYVRIWQTIFVISISSMTYDCIIFYWFTGMSVLWGEFMIFTCLMTPAFLLIIQLIINCGSKRVESGPRYFWVYVRPKNSK